MHAPTATTFGATLAYRLHQRVEARGVGGTIITGTVVTTRGGIVRDDMVEVHWHHHEADQTVWETPEVLRPAKAALSREQKQVLATAMIDRVSQLAEFWDEMAQGYHLDDMDQQAAIQQLANWMGKLPGTAWSNALPSPQ